MALIGIFFIGCIFWVVFFKDNYDSNNRKKRDRKIIEKNNQELQRSIQINQKRINDLKQIIISDYESNSKYSMMPVFPNPLSNSLSKNIEDYIRLKRNANLLNIDDTRINKIIKEYQESVASEQAMRERQLKYQINTEQIRLNSKLSFYKSDWENFKAILQQKGITKLYHFTDRSNLVSIKQNGGLFSWHYCKQNNISISKPGGSQTSWLLDQRKGLQNYVRISFVRSHPMLFVAQNEQRISNPVILEISIDVIYLKSTKYACQNAASNNVFADSTLEAFNKIKFDLFNKRYFDLSDDEKHHYQAEVLVLEKIPLESIININNV